MIKQSLLFEEVPETSSNEYQAFIKKYPQIKYEAEAHFLLSMD